MVAIDIPDRSGVAIEAQIPARERGLGGTSWPHEEATVTRRSPNLGAILKFGVTIRTVDLSKGAHIPLQEGMVLTTQGSRT